MLALQRSIYGNDVCDTLTLAMAVYSEGVCGFDHV